MPPRIAAAPVSVGGHCWPLPPQETLKHSQAGLAASIVGITVPFRGSWCIEGLVGALQASLSGMRFYFKLDCAPPTFLFQLLLCPWTWGIDFLGGIQHSPVDGCSAASCDFCILARENERMSFYSAILEGKKSAACVCVCVCVCVCWSWVYLLSDQFFFSSENDGRISLAGGTPPVPVALWLGLANDSYRLATERPGRENLDYFSLLLSASGSFSSNTYISTIGPSPFGNIHLNARLLVIQGSRPK